MLSLYQSQARLAYNDFSDVVKGVSYVGGTAASPNKLRLALIDGSYLDIWLSSDGDYAYHWERRRQTGQIYRWDNAPHYRAIGTFPAHFHDGEESLVTESYLPSNPMNALREVLEYVRQRLH